MEKQNDGNSKYLEIALSIAQLVEEKNKVYGSAFEKSGAIFNILFPNGVSPSQYGKLLAVVRIIDKIIRLTNIKDSDPMEEDQFADIMGYALLAMYNSSMNENEVKNEEG